jgi:hypothetical protein
MGMIEGKTKSGFDFRVPEGLSSDANFLRTLVKFRNMKLTPYDRMTAVFDVVSSVFCDEKEEERFYQYFAALNSTGRTDINTIFTEITEIVNYCKEQDERLKK